jgi:hypothetical protein
MGHNGTGRSPVDRSRIDLNVAAEVQWWCHYLNVTAKELQTAVKAVGPLAVMVMRYLGRASLVKIQ